MRAIGATSSGNCEEAHYVTDLDKSTFARVFQLVIFKELVIWTSYALRMVMHLGGR